MAVYGGSLIRPHVAVDGVVAIKRAENALHNDLCALLRGEEPIAGL